MSTIKGPPPADPLPAALNLEDTGQDRELYDLEYRCDELLLDTDPPADLWPVLSKCARSHEQPNMTARHGLLNDAVFW